MRYKVGTESQPYVYKLTDLETDRQYIGVRYARGCAPEDLGITYFTNSKIIALLFRADPVRFKKQIVVQGDVDYVLNVEVSLITLHDAVLSDSFYNRGCGKAFHPDDIRAGALKEHAKRSPELYALIVKKMRAKNSPEKRSKILKARFASMSAFERQVLAQHMRDGKTIDSNYKIGIAAKKHAIEHPEHMSMMGKLGGKIGGPKGCKVTNSQSWSCNVCGMTTLPGPLGKHQSRSKRTGKTRVL